MNVRYMIKSAMLALLSLQVFAVISMEFSMKKHILFVTSNKGKLQEVQMYLSQLDPAIVLEQASVDLPEYQGLDIREIAIAKAQAAWAQLKKPLLIDDGGIYITRYNQFPGPLIKWIYKGIGLDGFWLLAKDDPRGYFLSCLVYCYGPDKYEVFEGICHGTYIAPTGTITYPDLPFTEIFVGMNTNWARISSVFAEVARTIVEGPKGV